MCALTQRQATGNLRNSCQVKPIGFQFIFLLGFACCSGTGHGQVAAGPGQAVKCIEGQALGCKIKAVSQQPPADPASDRCKRQRCQFFAKLNNNFLKRNIQRCTANLAFADINPGSKAAMARCGIDTECVYNVRLDLRHIANLREVGVQLTRPVSKVARAF